MSVACHSNWPNAALLLAGAGHSREAWSRRIGDYTVDDASLGQRIVLSTYREATIYCGNRAPATPIQAQFSLAFGIASMLRFGVLDAGAYRGGRFTDPEVRRLEALVEIEIDPAFETSNRRGGSLLVSAGYRDVERDVRAIPGDPSMPLSAEEVAAKFMRYAEASVPNEKAFVFANAVLASEVDVNMRVLWDLLF